MGTPIREILENHAGGMQDGLQLKGFLPGGGSTDFLTSDHLDLAIWKWGKTKYWQTQEVRTISIYLIFGSNFIPINLIQILEKKMN